MFEDIEFELERYEVATCVICGDINECLVLKGAFFVAKAVITIELPQCEGCISRGFKQFQKESVD